MIIGKLSPLSVVVAFVVVFCTLWVVFIHSTSIFAGALTGILETLLLYPLEHIKVQQQLSVASPTMNPRGRIISAGSLGSPGVASPTSDSAFDIVTARGISGLYKGVWIVILGSIPNQAVRWTAYDFCSIPLTAIHSSVWSWRGPLMCGIFAGIWVALITGIPVESIKVSAMHGHRIDLDRSAEDDSRLVDDDISFVGETRSSKDATALRLQGWLPTVLKKVLNHAIRFPVHEKLLQLLVSFFVVTTAVQAVNGVTEPGVLVNAFSDNVPGSHANAQMRVAHLTTLRFLSGIVAGIAGTIATHPIDVVKTRMQALSGEKYKHSLDCAKRLLYEEGFSVFLSGFLSRVLRTGLGTGVTFALYPAVKSLIEAMN